MDINKLMEMDMSQAVEWLVENKERFALVPRNLSREMRLADHESMERHEDGQAYIGCPDDQWTVMIEKYEATEEQG